MSALEKQALAPSLFVHFTNPKTGEEVFDVFPEGHPQAGEEDESKPVGVRIYGPGSKEYRAAQTAITNEAIERKRRKVTAELIEKNAVELLARTTSEFVNFDYEGKGASVETCRAFYLDVRYPHLREQVQAAHGDFGSFLQQVSSV